MPITSSAALAAVTYAPPRPTPAPASFAATSFATSFASASTGRAASAAAPGLAAGVAAPAAVFDALLDALRTEHKLVDELAATMRRQRQAVAGDDLATVDDTVFATHRVLATLGQARLRRRQLNRLFAGADEVPVRALAAAACDRAPGGPDGEGAARVRAGADLLLAGATALAREVDVNRRVLRDALAGGDDHARALGAAVGAPDGALVDRTA